MRTWALCDLQQVSSPITSSESFSLLPLSLHLRDPSQVLRPGVKKGGREEDRGKRKKKCAKLSQVSESYDLRGEDTVAD